MMPKDDGFNRVRGRLPPFLLFTAVLAVPVVCPARAVARCAAIPGAEAILKHGMPVVLGEVHGNAETPRFVADLACLAAERGAVRVGLEMPQDEQARLDAFLSKGDRKGLFAGPFWNDKYQDGRRSVGMVTLLEALHRQFKQGSDVKVFAFDVPTKLTTSPSERESRMAEQLLLRFNAEPRAAFLILVGDAHAARSSTLGYLPMTARIEAAGRRVTTLKARYGHGTTWICRGDDSGSCGAANIGDGNTAVMGIALQSSSDGAHGGAYDGTFDVPAPSLSPPAVVALTGLQRLNVELVQLLATARKHYDDKKFTACADKQMEIATMNPGVRPFATFNAACCLAREGDRDAAFAALFESLNAGFSDVATMEKEKDLATLHQDSRWALAVDRIRRPKVRNESLRKYLEKLGREDQEENQRSYEQDDPAPSRAPERQEALKRIIEEFGWPRTSLVGEAAAQAAWLIAQHADDDLPFQRSCLQLLERSFREGEASGFHLAYLTDRVLMNAKRPQTYGTQSAHSHTADEILSIDGRRRKIGVASMAAVARQKRAFYQEAYRQAARVRTKGVRTPATRR